MTHVLVIDDDIVAMSGEPPQFGFDFLETACELGTHATIGKPFRAEELAVLIAPANQGPIPAAEPAAAPATRG